LGGLQSRRIPVLAVLAVSQPTGLLIALAAATLIGADSLSAGKAGLAFLGGALAVAGLGAFYAALAMGTMSVVTPIAALGVVVPVVVGLANGEAPTELALVGLVIAIAGGVVLGYEEEPDHSEVSRRAILLALLSAVAFGVFFALLDAAAVDRPGWTIVAARCGGVLAVTIGLLALRPQLRGIPAVLPALMAIGALDVTANTLFTLSTTLGLLPVVAVGSSMGPAFTVALAHLSLGERLRPAQSAGVGLALAGVVLIAAGSG
jgi:drug/metabolite transporter (DMT)-like permease